MALKEKYINPFTDFGFKKIFGSEPNKELLIDFLNNVILPSEKKIVSLSFKKNDQIGNTKWDRGAVYDLYCEGKNGERFIVEMQKAKQKYFKDRSIFYSTFPIQEQAPIGEWDFKLNDVYTVAILDFVFEEDKELKQVRHEVKLKDQNCNVFYDKLSFIYLEMPNFKKTEEELETIYDKWLYVLKQLPYLQNKPQKLQEKIFQNLFRIAEIANFSPQERLDYEESVKNYRDMKNVIDTAVETAIEKGKIEAKSENIIKCLKGGKLTLEEIAYYNDVPIEFVLEIKKENKL